MTIIQKTVQEIEGGTLIAKAPFAVFNGAFQIMTGGVSRGQVRYR
jgi:hypothetical protein